jgi:hypothetical protein
MLPVAGVWVVAGALGAAVGAAVPELVSAA